MSVPGANPSDPPPLTPDALTNTATTTSPAGLSPARRSLISRYPAVAPALTGLFARPLTRPLAWAGFEALPRALGLALAVFLLLCGLQLRDALFPYTAPVRFRPDISNGLTQGTRVLERTGFSLQKGQLVPLSAIYPALVRTYDAVYDDAHGSGRYSLDYAPLRLLVMTLWARSVVEQAGPWRGYSDAYAPPLLHLNTACALLSAVGVFLIVRHVRRQTSPVPPFTDAYRTPRRVLPDLLSRHSGWALGLVAAALVFFNAAVLICSHAFPQWDVWLLPFVVFTIVAGFRRRWLLAGFCFAFGAMLKGQGLLVLPVLLVWAFADGRWSALLRFTAGFFLAPAIVLFPWLCRTNEAWTWMSVSLGSVVLFAFALHALRTRLARRPGLTPRRRLLLTGLLSLALLAALTYPTLTCPALNHSALNHPALADSAPPAWTALVVALALLAAASLLRAPLPNLPVVLVGAFAATALLSGVRFGGSFSWYAIGYVFPADHYQELAMGPTANFPALLKHRYHWKLKDTLPVPPFPQWLSGLTFQAALRLVYFALLLPVCLATYFHARQNSPRLLVCLVAPWILFFAFVPQMHERYLLWGAALSAACIVLGAGQFFLHLAASAACFSLIAVQLLRTNPLWWPQANRIFFPLTPDIGWAVTLLALVYLAACFPLPPLPSLFRLFPLSRLSPPYPRHPLPRAPSPG